MSKHAKPGAWLALTCILAAHASAGFAGVVSYPLAKGAQLKTRLSSEDFRGLDQAMRAGTFESLRTFEAVDRGPGLKLEEKSQGWLVTNSSLEDIDSALNVDLAELARKRLTKSKDRLTMLDWGCGNGRALMELEGQLRGLPVDFVGFGDMPFAQWWKAPRNITFILDKAQNLSRYFKAGDISLVYSHLGLEHLHGIDLNDHLLALGGLLSPDGEIRMNGAFMKEELPKDFKLRRPSGGKEGWILKK